MLPHLPIDDVMPDILSALDTRRSVVIVAPPGAGKTTRVPLALLDAPWLEKRKILVLEPRRLAARGAAHQMARLLGEKVGDTVGMRARLGTVVGPRTQIEVVTEGVFIRVLLDDPSLEGVGAVLFDEFHERSLDADLGLALTLDARRGLREDLRLAVMSATLSSHAVARMIGDAAVIESVGRMFPVETRYIGRAPDKRLEDAMATAIVRALDAEPGSLLAFLPGQAEIRRVAERLADTVRDPAVDVLMLHSGLGLAAQDDAVAPAAPGRRKVVLATSIAETSLTIEGIRIVVDSGLQRSPRYDAGAGVTRLVTERASRASADQRRGRAGRTEPGVCYRLWDEPQDRSLAAYAAPEIMVGDLAPLLLAMADWGIIDPSRLMWLDPPPQARLEAARRELVAIGALDTKGMLTPLGRDIGALALPPRIGAMVIATAARGASRLAAEIAALIVERGLGGSDSDIATRLARFRADRSRRAADMRRLSAAWAHTALDSAKSSSSSAGNAAKILGIAGVLALGFPDRIAKSRGGGGQFLLANGRGAYLPESDPLARAQFLVVADMSGSAQQTRITLAAELDEKDLADIARARTNETVETVFDETARALRTRRVQRLGEIVLKTEPLAVPANEESAIVLAQAIAEAGIDCLPWRPHQIQIRARVGFLAQRDGQDWPDLSDAALAARTREWLAPFLIGKLSTADISADDLDRAMQALLTHQQRHQLDEAAPTQFLAPTGHRHVIDYTGPNAPSVAIRVQELFGLKAHPTIAGGRLALTLELLSPAGRPIQTTRDLPGFWAGSWRDVRAEMRGKYPKHSWPEKPQDAAPTTRAKPRGS
jgi:ATP-dependent helicase HrpB